MRWAIGKRAKGTRWCVWLMSRIAVIGAGAWGTALAIQAARAGGGVVLVARDPGSFAGRCSKHLAGFPLPAEVTVTDVAPAAADLTLFAVPTQYLRSACAGLPDAPVLVCAKGVELGTLRLPLEILRDQRPDLVSGVLTGPNFAHEVAQGLPAAAVLAMEDDRARAAAIGLIATHSFRIYGNDDAIGAQVGGAAKNVIAIAAGAVIGAGLGENARAALITRGLAEMSRLALALGGRAETATGLSGLGDLLLTCTGNSSRNYSLGLALGRGESLDSILAGRSSVTEGVLTAPALVARAAPLELPIAQAVAGLLGGVFTLAQAIEGLLARPRKDEHR